MRFDNQSSSLQLFKLAFGSAKFSPRRVLTSLLVILLFATGSLYIVNQVYQGKLKLSFVTEKTGPTKDKDVEATKGMKKQPISPPQEFYTSPELRELRQKEKQRAINRLKSRLQASSMTKVRRDVYQRTDNPRHKMLWGKQATEKLARHQSILAHSDEVAKLQLQDQQLHSEEGVYPPPPDEEDIPPPPKQKPGFWGRLGKEMRSALKELLRKFI